MGKQYVRSMPETSVAIPVERPTPKPAGFVWAALYPLLELLGEWASFTGHDYAP